MKREKWIDILRGIAILAIVLDHAYFLYPEYKNTIIWWHTYFSIPWFVFLSGVTNTLSAGKKTWVFPKSHLMFIVKRFSLLLPYIIASLICYVLLYYRNLRLDELWQGLLLFSIQPTFYFINLILQLYLIFPFLYFVIKKTGRAWYQYLFLLLTGVLAGRMLMVSPPPWPFSPAGRAFGGVYLAMFLAGMLFATVKLPLNRIVIFFAGAVFLGFEAYLFSSRGSFISIVPSYPLLIWSLSLLLLAIKFISLTGEKNMVFKALSYLGRYSIYIYLFHYLVLELIRKI